MARITVRDVAVLLIGILIGVVIIGCYVHARLIDLSRTYDSEQRNLAQEFITLAEQADRIEAIAESKNAVPDCSSRARYEELLSTLPTLKAAERNELDLLFASCGDYHARLKTFYAERLSSMSARYGAMRTLHDTLFASDSEEEQVQNAMNTITESEQTRAQDLFLLVTLQRTMNDVYAGRSARTLSEVTTEAGTVEKRFAETDRNIDEARTEIASLIR